MDTLVDLGSGNAPTGIGAPVAELWNTLTPAKQYWIEYRACHGYYYTEEGRMARMSVLDCAAYLGVTDQTLHNWEKKTDRFWEMVGWRRKSLFSNKVVAATWGATAAKASVGEDGAVERILTNFDPSYKSPKQKIELDVGDNMVEIFSMMRNEARIIDGDYTETDAGAGEVDSAQRPADIPSQS